jgi:death on curing protein
MTEPIWLSIEEVIETNRDVVLRTGEPFLILNRGLLESAVASPANRYHYGGERDTVTLAVGLLFSLARNHAFEQGNKRTAFVSAPTFLETNGFTLALSNTELLGKQITLVIEGKLDEPDFLEFLQPYIVPNNE